MALLIWTGFLLIVIAIKYGMLLFYKYVDKKRVIDNKTLEESVREADQYEIAYLVGKEKEVFQLAFYTLVKSGYLIALDKEDSSSYPPKRYFLDKSKNLGVLHVIEKAAALSYDESTLLPDDPKKIESVAPILKKYKEKEKKLFLRFPERLIAFAGCFMVAFLIIVPILYFLTSANKINSILMAIIGVVAFILMKKIDIATYPQLTLNGKRYLELFEKIHFPYPDFKKPPLKDYLERISPCSL